MADVGVLNIRITSSMENFQEGVRKTQSHLTSMDATLGRIQRTLIAFVAVKVFREMAEALKDVVTKTGDLSLSMAHIARLSGIEGTALNELTASLKNLSLEVPVSINKLAEMGQIAAQAGVQTSEGIAAIVKTSGQLQALDKNLGTEQTIRLLAQLPKAYNDSITSVDKYASALLKAGDMSVGGTAEVAQAVFRMISAGKTLDIMPPVLMAIGSMAIDMGAMASRGGTEWNRAMTQMAINFEKVAKVIDVSSVEMKKIIDENPTEALVLLMKKLSEIPSKAERLIILKDIFGEIGLKAIAPMIPKIDELGNRIEILNQTFKEGTYIEEQYKKIQEEFAIQWKILGQAIDLAKIALGEELLPLLKEFVKSTIEWIKTDLVKHIKLFGEIIIAIWNSGALQSLGRALGELKKSGLIKWVLCR